jgi:hypothetical protein
MDEELFDVQPMKIRNPAAGNEWRISPAHQFSLYI